MKKIIGKIKLQIQAGQASPAPPVGPALGQYGLNIMDFCQKFNEATKERKDEIIPVEIIIYEDRTYDYKLKTPSVTYLLKKAAGIEKGSGETPRKKVGKVTKSQLREIAEIKMSDLPTDDINEAVKIIEGTAHSMGLEIVE